MNKSRALACVAISLSLIASACGDDDEGSADTAEETTATTAATEATTAPEATTATSEATTTETTETSAPAGTEPAPVEGGDTSGVTDDTIRISGLFTASFFDGLDAGARARVARLNAEGGVAGRAIELVDVVDDGGDPAVAADAVNSLVAQNDVFLMSPISAPAFLDPTPLADAGIPYVGTGYGVPDPWCDAEFGFSVIGCLGGGAVLTPTVVDYPAYSAQLLADGTIEGKAVAIIGSDDAATADGSLRIFSGAYERAGARVTYAEAAVPAPPATVGDFSPFVQDVMTSNEGGAPDVVEILAPSPQLTIGLATGLRAAGFEGPILNYLLYDPRLAESAQGLYSVIQWGAWETDDPFVEQMRADMAAYEPDQLLTSSAFIGYLQMDFIITVLEAVGPNLSREAFTATANSITYDVPNVLGPLSFPANKTAPVPCQTLVEGVDGGYAVAVPYSCSDPIENPLLGD